MTSVLDIAIPVLGGLFILGALYFAIQGLAARRGVSGGAYGVARQEARQNMLVAFMRALFLLLIGLILFSIFGLSPGPGESGALPTPSSSPKPTVGQTPTATIAASNTAAPPDTTTPLPTPTPMPTLTITITPTVDATATADVATAVVNSPNGLWLREAPGGTQEVELIADGSSLTLLSGRDTVDDLEWQQVQTPAGNEGWVAVEFIVYQ